MLNAPSSTMLLTPSSLFSPFDSGTLVHTHNISEFLLNSLHVCQTKICDFEKNVSRETLASLSSMLPEIILLRSCWIHRFCPRNGYLQETQGSLRRTWRQNVPQERCLCQVMPPLLLNYVD
jgi:hypothetical protein